MILLTRHIEVIRRKPEPVRRQVALGAAVFITALIALLWLGVSLLTGSFALGGSNNSFAEATETPAPSTQTARAGSGIGNFFGAAGAVLSGGRNEPAHVEVVETAGAEPTNADSIEVSEPTVIPF
jgi:hypothetical protein